jgi:mycothione reductase
VHAEFHGADWQSIVQRVFGRIDPIEAGGRQYRHSLPNVDVYEHSAHFVGPHELEVMGEHISGDRIVIAAGARPFVPDIPGLDDVPFHTSDTIMRIARQPKHLIVLGGGFIASELGHVFRSFGSEVTLVNRGHRLLQAEDVDVSRRFTELAAERFDLALGAHIDRVRMTPGGVALELICDGSGRRVIEGDVLLVAAGRVPNSDQLRVEAAGIATDDRGNVLVDAFGRTNVEGVWALGDINGRHQLKHMANGEAKAVRHNLFHPDALMMFDPRPAPHAVFAHPQVGAIGVTEQQAQHSGAPHCIITHAYGEAAYGWAMEDTSSFCKLIGDPVTRTVIGAHIIGYQASLMVQLLVQGMHLGNTVDEMALGQVWIHPTLAEVVEQALLKLIDAFDAFDADR